MSAQSGKYKDDQMNSEKSYMIEDSALDASIKAYRKAALELQEIMNDPCLEETRKEVSTMISEKCSHKGNDSYREKEKYIKDSIGKTESSPKAGINNIKISKSDISDLSAEWVREWHKKKQMQVYSEADQERRNFISASIKSEDIIHSDKGAESAKSIVIPERKTRLLRLTSIAAAAVLGILISIKTLVPSGNTEKIYASFYLPFDDAVTLVTRGDNNESAKIYNQALYSYKAGKFEEASLGFAEAQMIDPSLGTPSYYIGLASMETGDYDKAVTQFLDVISKSGNYVKEARWYLGLAYLKTGDKDKAAECFRELSKTEGYFSKPAEKILRRLK